MSKTIQVELSELARRWREKAVRYMADANEPARRSADIVRLTAMASTLEWAACEIESLAGREAP